MCPMYVLVMEELARQYRASGMFVEDYANDKSLIDAIMDEQGKELGADRFDKAAEKDQNSWVAGRLTRQLRREEEEAAREERKRVRLEAEAKAKKSSGGRFDRLGTQG